MLFFDVVWKECWQKEHKQDKNDTSAYECRDLDRKQWIHVVGHAYVSQIKRAL